MALENSIITAVSTLLAVGITLFFTTKREKSKFMQDIKLKEFIDLEAFYVNLISSIEKAKSYTKRGDDYKELLHENSILSAKANLLAPNSINEQLGKVSALMYEWSSYYRESLPTKIGDTGFGMVTNTDFKFRDKADEVYPNLNREIGKLIELIKEEINTQKKLLNK